MQIDWDDLRLFLTVARADSLSEAGRRLGLNASTVGRRMARLERALGTVLFAKTPQGYLLTDAGERLRPHAEAAERAAFGATEALGRQEGLSGQLRIGAPDGCANHLLPHVCTALMQENPGLEIQIVALPRVVSLSRREADMAIVVSPPDTGRLTVQKLADYHLFLAARRDWLSERDEIRTPQDLRRHRIVGYIPDMIFDRGLDYLAVTGAEAAQLTSNSASVQLQMLRAGAGIGFVHDFCLAAAPELALVLADELVLKRSFYLIRHADDRRSPRLTRLTEALTTAFRQEISRLQNLAAAGLTSSAALATVGGCTDATGGAKDVS